MSAMSSPPTASAAAAPALHAVRKRPRFQMARTVFALMLREMATTYGRSAGGYAWAVIEPVLGIAFLSLIFSFALAKPPLGDSFALFYATGYLPFVVFLQTANKIARSVAYSRPFLAYPAVTFMDAILARLLLNGLTGVVVTALIVAGIIVLYDLPLQIDIGRVGLSLLLSLYLAAAFGTLNCYLLTSFPVWDQVWMIITRPLFLISGVFFMYHHMPPEAQGVLWYNPLIHTVGMMRSGVYQTYPHDYVSAGYVAVLASVVLFFGLLLLVRHFKRLMES